MVPVPLSICDGISWSLDSAQVHVPRESLHTIYLDQNRESRRYFGSGLMWMRRPGCGPQTRCMSTFSSMIIWRATDSW